METENGTVFVNCEEFTFDFEGSSEDISWPFQFIHGLFKIESTFYSGVRNLQGHRIVLYPGASAMFELKDGMEVYLSNNAIPGQHWFCPSCSTFWKKRAAKEEPPIKCPKCQTFLSRYQRTDIDLFEIEQRLMNGLEGKDGVKVIQEKEYRMLKRTTDHFKQTQTNDDRSI